MADICMCSGEGCKLNQTCYRFLAPKNPRWQSMFVRPPFKETQDNGCDHYWKISKSEAKKLKEMQRETL